MSYDPVGLRLLELGFWERAYIASWNSAQPPFVAKRQNDSPEELKRCFHANALFAAENCANAADFMLSEWRKRWGAESSAHGERPEQPDAQQPPTESPKEEGRL